MNDPLKRIDYEVLKEIQDLRERGMIVLTKQFTSNSSKYSRFLTLKERGYIGKEGKAKGRGTHFLTEQGNLALQSIPEDIKIKGNGHNLLPEGLNHYRITIESLTGLKKKIEVEHICHSAEIYNALSIIGTKKEKRTEAEKG